MMFGNQNIQRLGHLKGKQFDAETINLTKYEMANKVRVPPKEQQRLKD